MISPASSARCRGRALSRFEPRAARVGIVVAFGALLLAVAPAFAQSEAPPAAPGGQAPFGGPPGGRGFGAGAGRRPGGGRMFLVLRIADALHLNDEQTIKVASSFRSIDEKRQKLRSDKDAVESQLDAELARKPIDEAKVSSLTQQALAIDRQLLLLPEEMYNSIQGMLTVEQRARLLLLRSHLLEQVQRERERRGLGRTEDGDQGGASPSPVPGTAPRRGTRRFFPG
jgi:Spy/CpxP family protein refolding chaperone